MSKAQKAIAEFKQKVIEDMLENKLGYNETQQKYGLPNRRVQSWERIYREEGVQGLDNVRFACCFLKVTNPLLWQNCWRLQYSITFILLLMQTQV